MKKFRTQWRIGKSAGARSRKVQMVADGEKSLRNRRQKMDQKGWRNRKHKGIRSTDGSEAQMDQNHIKEGAGGNGKEHVLFQKMDQYGDQNAQSLRQSVVSADK